METSRIREFKNFCLAALLIASATLTACSSSDDNIIEEQPVQPREKVYTMTIQATKATGDDATTRGLSLDGHTLNVHWNEGEEVEVVQYAGALVKNTVIGTLTATPDPNDPTKATLTGTLDKFYEDTDIKFYLHSYEENYYGQSGVLLSKDGENSIEEKYDYASCFIDMDLYSDIVKVQESDGGYLITIEGGITLESSQSIVKFALVDKANGTTPINATRFEVFGKGSLDEDVIDVTPATATNELYVAVPFFKILKLKAVTAAGDVYTYETNTNISAGQYYEVRVKMTKQAASTVDLATVGGDHIAVNGDVLKGTLAGKHKISITDGATVTLNNVTIEGVDQENYQWAGITCEGNATIIIEGENTVQGFYYRYPGISVPSGKTLTIRGSGSLVAKSNQGEYGSRLQSGAGIGGILLKDCGNIVIESGTITATGSYCSAGIGSSNEHSCGTITITGGTVTATGGDGAAGIGSAYRSTCGNITITGGTVTATGGYGAAAIGCGMSSDCGDITIGGTARVTVTKGANSPYCIGLGNKDKVGEITSGTITIGSTVYYDSSTKTWASTELEDKLKADSFTYPAQP